MGEEVQLPIVGGEESFIRGLFCAYYEKCDAAFLAPPLIEQREFGLGTWNKKIESRHMWFKSPAELKSYLVRNTPFFISYSTAYYEFPDRRPMPKKNWLGADLVFDLDADHLRRECVEHGEHEEEWVCEKCLENVRDETIKLIEEFLMPDFGFSENEILINFSGQRGYHVHIRTSEILGMGSWARREIADYIAGVGLDASSIFPTINGRMTGPTPESQGWYGRIARRFLQLLEAEKLEVIGVEKSLARRFVKNKEKVIEGVKRGNWDTVKMTQQQKGELAKKVIESAGVHVEGFKEAGSEVDAGVTFDISKLIRLPESLHGETGLAARRISGVSELAGFDPLSGAVVFGDKPIRVKCSRVPKFIMKGVEYGPFNSEEVELPEHAAVYLICKRKATLWR